MNRNGFPPTHRQEPDSITYINGLGFVHVDPTRAVFLGIRRMSNLLCSCIILYFFLQNLFILPFTHFIYMLGGNIKINYFTGLIVATPISKATILFSAKLAAMLCTVMICRLVYRQCFQAARLFSKPYAGLTLLSIPIVSAIGLLGVTFSFLLSQAFGLFGLVFSFPLAPVTSFSVVTLYSFIISLLFAVVQEVFFRGVVLFPLRRFGDGFAVICASLLFALWSKGIPEFIISFFVALPLCYFVIRSGSIYPAIVSRLVFETLLFLFRLCSGKLESSLATVIVLLSVILIIFFAICSFVGYVKADRHAFFLKRPDDKLRLSIKLATFSCGLFFLISIVMFMLRVVTDIQIIG